MSKLQLLVATTNLKKLRELQELLVDLDIQCLSLKDFPLVTPVEETGKTFEANAELKALGYARQTGMLTLGEDSGLCCDALNGGPGVLSARFSGLDKNDDANNQKLLELLSDVPDDKRTAHYESVVVIAEPQRVIGVASGQVHGVIARELRGNGGFGYDPLFYYPPFQRTFGEITSEMKHSVSHRSQALVNVRMLLQEHLKKVSQGR